MKITFDGAEETPDRMNPENNPWLRLKITREGGSKGVFEGGRSRYKSLMDNLDKIKENIGNPAGICEIERKTNGKIKVEKLTSSLCEALVHYEPEIRAYIKKYAKPEQLILEPMEVYREDTQNIMNPPQLYLVLPCWEADDNDIPAEGATKDNPGMRPWFVSMWEVNLLMRKSTYGGKVHEKMMEHLKANPEGNFKLPWLSEKDNVQKEQTYDPAKIAAFLKYRARISEHFIANVSA